MSDINITKPTAAVVPQGLVSSAKIGDNKSEVAKPGLEPVDTAKAEVDAPVVTGEKINQAVAELNKFIQREQRDLLFSVDDGSGDVVVRVVDRDSGELIRQIPNDVVLDLAAHAREKESLQLINMYG